MMLEYKLGKLKSLRRRRQMFADDQQLLVLVEMQIGRATRQHSLARIAGLHRDTKPVIDEFRQ